MTQRELTPTQKATAKYKRILIDGILEFQTRNQFTEEELKKKSIRTLEIIHDNVD